MVTQSSNSHYVGWLTAPHWWQRALAVFGYYIVGASMVGLFVYLCLVIGFNVARFFG